MNIMTSLIRYYLPINYKTCFQCKKYSEEFEYDFDHICTSETSCRKCYSSLSKCRVTAICSVQNAVERLIMKVVFQIIYCKEFSHLQKYQVRKYCHAIFLCFVRLVLKL